MVSTRPAAAELPIAWFGWREVTPALQFAREGGIALHYFHFDLRRFGLTRDDPCCHLLGSDRIQLINFAGGFGLPAWALQADRPHRRGVWHFDAFGPALAAICDHYPPPDTVTTQ